MEPALPARPPYERQAGIESRLVVILSHTVESLRIRKTRDGQLCQGKLPSVNSPLIVPSCSDGNTGERTCRIAVLRSSLPPTHPAELRQTVETARRTEIQCHILRRRETVNGERDGPRTAHLAEGAVVVKVMPLRCC